MLVTRDVAMEQAVQVGDIQQRKRTTLIKTNGKSEVNGAKL